MSISEVPNPVSNCIRPDAERTDRKCYTRLRGTSLHKERLLHEGRKHCDRRHKIFSARKSTYGSRASGQEIPSRSRRKLSAPWDVMNRITSPVRTAQPGVSLFNLPRCVYATVMVNNSVRCRICIFPLHSKNQADTDNLRSRNTSGQL
jgi:hypothetical protein